jgi:hypothetical protein
MKKSSEPYLTRERAIEIYNSMSPEILKEITGLEQVFRLEKLEDLVTRHREKFQSLTGYFPELTVIWDIIDEKHAYYRTNEGSQAFYGELTYRKKAPQIVEINRRLKKSQRELAKQIAHFTAPITDLIKAGYASTSGPDVNCRHYQAAQELASLLITLWFVERVTLFGSVSRGEQRPDSDVDMGVTIISKQRSGSLQHLLDGCADKVMANYPDLKLSKDSTLFNLIVLNDNWKPQSKYFEKVGFFESAYPLAENKIYEIELDGGKYSFEKERLVGYAISNTGRETSQVAVYPKANYGTKLASYHVVLILGYAPVALFSIDFTSEDPDSIESETSINDRLSCKLGTDDDHLYDAACPLIDKVIDDNNIFDLLM